MTTKIVEYSDIAEFAETLGYGYNETISMMEKDRFIPFYETSSKEIYQSYGRDYGFSEELSEIFSKFVEVNGEVTVVD